MNRDYLDETLLHPELSSQAVCKFINWRAAADREWRKIIRLPVAAGAEGYVHEVQSEVTREKTSKMPV